MRLLTADQMRSADASAMRRDGEAELMRRAGVAVAAGIRRLAPDARRLVAFAGPGNNGGDAFAAFAELDGSCERTIFAVAASQRTEARAEAEARAHATGVNVVPMPVEADGLASATAGADLLVDALLGTGARSEPNSGIAASVDALNATPTRVLAIDVPTGIDATTGAAAPSAIRAVATITLGAVKVGLLLEPARAYCGALYLGDIGIDARDTDGLAGDRFAALDDREFLALLPRRTIDADKRSAGAPLVLAGSAQFPGAAVLCALGAARSGAGYVTVAAPENVASVLRTHLIEQVIMTYRDDDPKSVDGIVDLENHSSALAAGPGLGLSDAMGEIVRGVFARTTLPFVADASAFFHLAKRLDILRGKQCVITPHEREFARLSGDGTIKAGTRVDRLRAFVSRTGVTTLLKGYATLIDDGTTMHVNPTGSPALATAGTGDVLTGIIGTLLSQGLAPVDAARSGAYWHGLAGRSAARKRAVGVIARDVADALARALPVALRDDGSPLRLIAEP